jgi:hypothetical protein
LGRRSWRRAILIDVLVVRHVVLTRCSIAVAQRGPQGKLQ